MIVDRVRIGCNYVNQPLWKVIFGVPLIYLPIITTVPFVVTGVFLIIAPVIKQVNQAAA